MMRDWVIETWGGKLQCETRLIDTDATTGKPLKEPWWLVCAADGHHHFKTLLEALTWCEPLGIHGCKRYRRFRRTDRKVA